MKRIFLISIFCIVLLIGSVSAWEGTTFNNSLTTGDILFGGNENHTRWLSVPEHTFLVEGFFNLSGFGEPWVDISSVTYDDVWINSEGSDPTGIFFKPDGTKLYDVDELNQEVYQYTCSDAWDLSSCVYDFVWISLQSDHSEAIFFKPDGTRFYDVDEQKFYQYTCSDAWDLSSCVYDYVWMDSACGNPTGIFFKPDGTKFYEIEELNDHICQYVCSDAWNLSSCVYDYDIRIPTQDEIPKDLFFKPDGTKLYEVGQLTQKLYQYTCSDAWNLSSCVYDNMNKSMQDLLPNGMFINSEGTRLYECGRGGEKIYQYKMESYPNNPFLEIGTPDGTYEWNHTEEFNSTFSPNRTNNLASVLNSYLSGCSFANGFCLIPFLFHSDTGGVLQYSDLKFSSQGFTENSQTYNPTTYETSIEAFTINLSYSSFEWSSISGNLYYNGGIYPGTQIGSGDNILFNTSFGIPLVNSTTNNTFYWDIKLTNSSGTYHINSSIHNQTVQPITSLEVAHSCSVGLSPAMFFDFKNEQNLTSTNASIDYNFKFGVEGQTYKEIYGSLDNIDHFYLCINSTAHNNYLLSYGEIQYKKTGFTPRRFYTFTSQRLTNTTINNSLYILPNADATSFLFEFKNTALTPYKKKFSSLLRWYPNLNEYLVVEMAKTDDKGETIMRVKVEDVDYRVGLYHQNGTLIQLLSPVRFACLSSPCSYTSIVEEDPKDYTSFFGVETRIEYDEASELWTYTWNDPSQNTESMSFIVTRDRGDQVYVICDVSASGFTGVLTCDSTGYTGTLRAVAYRTASPLVPIAQKIIHTGSTVFKGSLGLFISFIIFLALALIGSYSPIASIILGIVGLFPAYLFGVITLPIFIAIGVIGGLVIHFMKRTG